MSLNVILGKPKTGKSFDIYNKIKEDIENKKEVVLFVPSQLRLETENKYMEYLKQDGIIGVNITTISEYVEKVITDLGTYDNEKYISKIDKKMILVNAISKCKDNLKMFKKVNKKEGFLELIYAYIDLLRKSNFDISLIDSVDIKNKITLQKLKEITQIYNEYLKELEENFVDSVDEINIFLNNISKLNFSNTCIYFDSYNNFTKNELLVIEKLIEKSKNVTLAITTDIARVEDIYANMSNEIFEVSNSTYLKLLNIANKYGVKVNTKVNYIKKIKQSEDIKMLSDNIFEKENVKKIDSKNVYINIFSNTFDEIKNVANVINSKIREGYRYREFEIYTSNIDMYKNLITRIFSDTNIPVYINIEENIKFSKLTLYTTKYLDILKNGINKNNMLDILKLGLTDINQEEIYELENYITEFNIGKYSINNQFKINNKKSSDHIYDISKLNTLREKVLSMYECKFDKKTLNLPNIYINNIFEHLTNNNIFKNYKLKLDNIENCSNEFDLANIEKEKQVWSKLCEIFNSISKVYKDKISFEEFSKVYMLGIKNTVIKATPPVIDALNVVDINLAKMSEKKIAFFIGVNEGLFPKSVDEDILFGDSELEVLKSNNIEFKETTVSKQNMQLYNIYQALNSVKQKLYISVPSSDFSGKNLRISDIINNIKKVLNIDIKGNVTNIDDEKNIFDIYSKEEMFKLMINNLNNNTNFEQTKAIYDYMNNNKEYNELLNYSKDDSNLKNETLKIIYNNNLTTSVSKLELFKKCPFSYYMKYLLKIEPRKEFEISSLDIGSFMHEVLETFSKYLFSNNIPWHTLLLDDSWQSVLDDIIEEKLDKNLDNKKQSIKYGILKQKLINTMKKVILVISKGFNQSEFIPYGYEIEFKKGGVFAPMQIKLDDDNYMNIIGKIDRVDYMDLDDKKYIRIIDYKSSKKDLKLDDIKEGISLQLITYLTSFIENLKANNNTDNILPCGMLYFNLSDKLVNLKDYISDEEKIKQETIKTLRMRGIFLKDIKVIEKMDNKISTNERLIDISKATLNKENTNNALDISQYDELFNEVKIILKNIGKEIIDGVVKINPNKKLDSCKYCNYSSICRKDSCV